MFDRMDADIDEELRSHIEMRADDLVKSGMDRAAAGRQARIEFGGQLKFKEATREAAGIAWLDTLIQDLRFSARAARKSPGFALTAIVTLALGIGANAVVFSVLNAFIIRPLDLPQAESLYQIERGPGKAGAQSYPDYRDLRDRNRTFDGLSAYDFSQLGLDAGDNNPTRVWALMTTGNYFDVLRIQPFLGRVFHAADERGLDSVPDLVLSHSYWHSHFHDDPSVVGRVVRLNKHPYTILGVTPPDFRGTLLFITPEVFVPVVDGAELEGNSRFEQRGVHWLFQTVGHLKDGVTPAQAIADLNRIGADLEHAYPKEDGQMTFTLARPGLYGDYLGPPVQGFLAALMLLAALILLAACANLGSLFAARAADRSREVALRLALGAGRGRIVRQLFTEAILVSSIGGAAGVAAGFIVLRALSRWQPFSRFPIHVPVTPDATVYLVALLVSIASGFLFGAVPVRQTLGTDPYEVVKSGAVGGDARRIGLRDLLLVAQIAICAVLVTSSIVAVSGLEREMHSRFGFEPANALLVEASTGMAGYGYGDATRMQKRMVESLEQLSGAEAVGLIDSIPLWGDMSTMMIFDDAATDLRPGRQRAESAIYRVSPDYLRAAGTVLLAGRPITWHDDGKAPRVAIVNQEFARRMFGSVASALGRSFKVSTGIRVQVVGIAENGKYQHTTEAEMPAMFMPFLQSPAGSTWLVIRSRRDPQELAAAARQAIRDIDPAVPTFTETWENDLNTGTAHFGARVATVSLGVLGAMGAMLSVTGIFGLAAYSLSMRRRELGIRMALGAQKREVLQAALGRALRLLAVGSSAGLVLGIMASRVLGAIVYQATPRDPIVIGGVVVAMALLGLIGTWIPAQRALAVSPLILLREE